jgi:hypothetical protein
VYNSAQGFFISPSEFDDLQNMHKEQVNLTLIFIK